MSRLFIDMLDDSALPKRGDLIQSNHGSRRERTWFILAVHPLRPRGHPRCRVWVERWWHVDPRLRMRLFASAERNGGQRVIFFNRYPAKRKMSFEEYLRRPVLD